jgi:hypothetical protein
MLLAVISNSQGKPQAIVVHDPKSGRVVFKGSDELHRSFEACVDKPVVLTEIKDGVQLRHKLPKSDPNYLKKLLDGFVHLPFKAILEEISGSHRIDSLADSLAEKHQVV